MTMLTREQVTARLKQLPSLPSAVSDLLASFSNKMLMLNRLHARLHVTKG